MMPLYDYHCEKCGKEHEEFHPMNDCPRKVTCECGGKAYKVCNAGGFQDRWGRAGGIQDDHPAWLPSSLEHLQTAKEAREHPIESRSEMYRYMERKGIRFKEPGSKVSPPAEPVITEQQRRKGIEAVNKARHEATSITVNL